MISVLIPTYDYITLPLVTELHQQLSAANIAFEIIVQDDASPLNSNTDNNQKINDLLGCRFERNDTNLGRGQNRNSLIQKAQFDWVLLMDCDMFPQSENFIMTYLEQIQNEANSVVYGGLLYQKEKPNKEQLLRWVFGKSREEIPLIKRQSNPYHYCLISNVLIRRDLLLAYPFSTAIYQYGYEDIVFILELKKHHIPIVHIENPAYHLNLESSAIFLEKFHSSLQNLKWVLDHQIIQAEDTALTRTYTKLRKFGLTRMTAFCFGIGKTLMTKHLLSAKPSLFVFDLYRLGYFCQLNLR